MRKVLAAVFGILLIALPVRAQDERPVGVNFGLGWTFPVGKFNDSFDAGFHGEAGLTYNITPTWGIQAEYMYQFMDGPEKTISVVSNPIAGSVTNGLLESNHHMHAGTFNVVGKTNTPDRMFQAYGLAGLGIYHRTVQITSPSVGYTTYCDPYWYVCYPALTEIDRILGDRSSNDFGMNFGGGVTFGHEAKFFIETRYHYVWGPKIAPNVPATGTSTPVSESSNGQYWPLTFGVRW